jgi:hypothetical protein
MLAQFSALSSVASLSTHLCGLHCVDRVKIWEGGKRGRLTYSGYDY